jgi:hypothetical protein
VPTGLLAKPRRRRHGFLISTTWGVCLRYGELFVKQYERRSTGIVTAVSRSNVRTCATSKLGPGCHRVCADRRSVCDEPENRKSTPMGQTKTPSRGDRPRGPAATNGTKCRSDSWPATVIVEGAGNHRLGKVGGFTHYTSLRTWQDKLGRIERDCRTCRAAPGHGPDDPSEVGMGPWTPGHWDKGSKFPP